MIGREHHHRRLRVPLGEGERAEPDTGSRAFAARLADDIARWHVRELCAGQPDVFASCSDQDVARIDDRRDAVHGFLEHRALRQER